MSLYLSQIRRTHKDVTFAALKVVAERYRAVGWNARVEDDRRDGAFVVIDANNPA